MKILLKIILIVVIAFIGSGLYLQRIGAEKADLIIGFGVLILAFVLMPLFIYNGYKGKDLTRYSFKNMQGPEEKEKN